MIYPLTTRCPECQARGFHLPHCSAHVDHRLARSSALRQALGSQLDELLNAVRQAEANWRFDDLLDVVARREGWVRVREPGGCHPK
jgi:hypothetical protein